MKKYGYHRKKDERLDICHFFNQKSIQTSKSQLSIEELEIQRRSLVIFRKKLPEFIYDCDDEYIDKNLNLIRKLITLPDGGQYDG